MTSAGQGQTQVQLGRPQLALRPFLSQSIGVMRALGPQNTIIRPRPTDVTAKTWCRKGERLLTLGKSPGSVILVTLGARELWSASCPGRRHTGPTSRAGWGVRSQGTSMCPQDLGPEDAE